MALRVALIGCGDIAHAYTVMARRFRSFEIVACASRNPARAQAFAAQYGLAAVSVEEALSGAHGIEAILNLTPPASHFAVSMAALENGLHVYSEKPIAASLAEGRQLASRASAGKVRLGGAPDTFLGAALQRARRLIDDGRIGEVVFGHANFISGGMEHRHPNPEFFFKPGGGPALDIGPYYVTALVCLLGPVASVCASGRVGRPVRTITAPESPHKGSTITVDVFTTIQAQLLFASGATLMMTLSWDGWESSLPHIELHGTGGRLVLPDPDFFGGELELSDSSGRERIGTNGLPLGAENWPPKDPMLANYRGIGLADFAQSIADGQPHRASAELCLHVLEVLEAMNISAKSDATPIRLSTSCARPPALDTQQLDGMLVEAR